MAVHYPPTVASAAVPRGVVDSVELYVVKFVIAHGASLSIISAIHDGANRKGGW